MGLFRRRTDHESHALHVERDHSADLARQLAEAHEIIHDQALRYDALLGDHRELIYRAAEMRAQLATTVEAKR